MYQLEVQYDLFKTPEECKVEALESLMNKCLASSDKVRKGMFARHGELCKQILDLQNRLDIVERGICEGTQ